MRLLEAIVDANHRAVAGDTHAGLRPAEFEEELPLVGLTCIDPRLNSFFPSVLGLPGDQFIWLRNAGNVITGPLSSTTRSVSLACVVKGGREIAVIGHTDCQIRTSSTMQLLEGFQAYGIGRANLPDNLNEFFGLYGSERQNVIKAVDLLRQSPIISPHVPIHGLIVDSDTGKLEWLVNGYEILGAAVPKSDVTVDLANQTLTSLKELAAFKIGELKFPEGKVGEVMTGARDWLTQQMEQVRIIPASPPAAPAPTAPPPHPVPPRIRPRIQLKTPIKPR